MKKRLIIEQMEEKNNKMNNFRLVEPIKDVFYYLFDYLFEPIKDVFNFIFDLLKGGKN